MNNRRFIVFSAPSGAGKTTIVNYVMEHIDNSALSVSAATREIRKGEVDGKSYHFISVEKFKEMIAEDKFLEWEEVYENNFYGSINDQVFDYSKKGKIVFFDIDVHGAMRLKSILGNQVILIFIRPPSISELRKRLKKRGTESSERINTRIKKAKSEMTWIRNFDKVILNKELDKACMKALETVKNFIK